MGLYKRKGKWYLDVRQNGKRRRISTGTTNKKEADNIHAGVLLDIRAGRWALLESTGKTFTELRERYMTEHSDVHKSPKSNIRDRSCFNHLAGFLGNIQLRDITPSRIAEYKSLRRTQGIKPATLARELEVLRHALNLAVREWEWIEKSPFEKVRIEKVNNKMERWLTGEEEVRLLGAALGWLREIILFALNTGMRQNEILSLQWSQVDLFRRTATLLETKNKEKRTVPLNQTLCELLKTKNKVVAISGYVFTSEAGTRIDARNLLRAFYKARCKAGLEEVRFHDLRHTFATRLVQAGINIYEVKELLGHKTLAMTMRYAHHYPESLRHAVDVLDTFGHNLVTMNKKGVTAITATP